MGHFPSRKMPALWRSLYALREGNFSFPWNSLLLLLNENVACILCLSRFIANGGDVDRRTFNYRHVSPAHKSTLANLPLRRWVKTFRDVICCGTLCSLWFLSFAQYRQRNENWQFGLYIYTGWVCICSRCDDGALCFSIGSTCTPLQMHHFALATGLTHAYISCALPTWRSHLKTYRRKPDPRKVDTSALRCVASKSS